MIMHKYFISLLSLLLLFTYINTVHAETNNSYTTWQDNDTAPLSALEQAYARRLTDAPKQFGYDIFNNINEQSTPMGAVQDDFILGAGDSLQITFTGQRTDQNIYKINSSGALDIKDFPSITAIGMTILQLRNVINAHLNAQHNTQAYVSLSNTRQIGVLVVGHVKTPGRKNLSAFSEILDALMLSNGITKDGSLRNIKLVRKGKTKRIDLYDLLINGAPFIDMRLKDGDRIIIPPIGPTVAISGSAKRTGIYEIRSNNRSSRNYTNLNSEKLSLNEMLKLAGGILTTGKNRFLKLSLTATGEELIAQIHNPNAKIFSDSTILSVLKDNEKRRGTIKVTGHSNSTGLHDLSHNKTLADILQNDNIIKENIYPLIGVIKRWNNEQLTSSFISYPLRLVLKNKFNMKMQDNDEVILLSNQDISMIYQENNNKTSNSENMDKNSIFIGAIFKKYPTLKSFLKEHSVFIRGAVRTEGLYPIAQGTTLDNLLAIAGGITLEANKENIEITTQKLSINSKKTNRSKSIRTTINLNITAPENIELSAGDAVRVNQKFHKMNEKTVIIIGEVANPGTYDLLAGDKVLDLINRAGDITEQGYPAGAIFSRKSERKTEEKRFRSAAINMQSRLAAAIQNDKNPPDAAQIEMVRALAEELSTIEAVGRITVETNPAILKSHPELNMLLESGDRIYIPKRPLTVRVSGDVLSPASLQFRENKGPLDYIHEAGGFTYNADKNRAFVLYPDGSAQPLKVNVWNHNPIFIPPGSTIIVPRDPKPFDFIESAKDITQILSNLAVTSVFIHDIRD